MLVAIQEHEDFMEDQITGLGLIGLGLMVRLGIEIVIF